MAFTWSIRHILRHCCKGQNVNVAKFCGLFSQQWFSRLSQTLLPMPVWVPTTVVPNSQTHIPLVTTGLQTSCNLMSPDCVLLSLIHSTVWAITDKLSQQSMSKRGLQAHYYVLIMPALQPNWQRTQIEHFTAATAVKAKPIKSLSTLCTHTTENSVLKLSR